VNSAFFYDPVLGLSVVLDPQAQKNFSLDWGTERLAPGDSLVSSTWQLDPALTLLAQSFTSNTNITTIKMALASGAEPGNYQATNVVVTNQITDVWSFTVQVREEQ
jgi:hypothetical protein